MIGTIRDRATRYGQLTKPMMAAGRRAAAGGAPIDAQATSAQPVT